MKLNDKNRFLLVIINFSILILSGFIDLFYLNGEGINTMGIRGFSLVVIAHLFLLCRAKKYDKSFNNMSIIFAIGGYGLSFYTVYRIYSLYVYEFKLSIGFILYFMSLVIYIYSIIKLKDEEKRENLEKYNLVDVDEDLFMICNMIVGLKEIKYNCVLLIKNCLEFGYLLIEYKENDSLKRIEIKKEDIIEVKYDVDVLVNHKKSDNSTRDASFLVIYSILVSTGIGAVSSIALSSLMDSYNGTNTKTWFNIEISFKKDNELVKLKVYTSKQPKSFVDKINDYIVDSKENI